MSSIDFFNQNKLGQINLNSSLGNYIYTLCKNPKIKIIVEIGTWNGYGSTKCILDAIEDDISKHLITVELYSEMYEIALINIHKYIKNLNQITILNGSIINYEDVFWFDHSTLDLNNDEHAKLWYLKDMNLLKNAKNILSKIPDKIDLLILDGGEYTSYPEYKILKERCNIIILDDIFVHKNNKVYNELMLNTNFDLLYHSHERNGYAIFQLTDKNK